MTDTEISIPHCMDFEASGLGVLSYPIEVAWSSADGSVSECWLIEPARAHGWALQDGWEAAAERVHGIAFEKLAADGRPAHWIAARMNAQLAGRSVYVDGGAADQVWCRQLFAAAKLEPQFEIGDFWELILDVLPPSRTRQTGWQYALQDAAWKRVQGKRHRADVDVRYLVELYRIARDGPRRMR